MLTTAYVGARSADCILSSTHKINATIPISPTNLHETMNYTTRPPVARKNVDHGRMSNIEVCTSSTKNCATKSVHSSGSCACPPRSYSDLMSVGKCSSNVIRFKSLPSPRPATCTTGMEQRVSACAAHSPENGYLVNNHGIMKQLCSEKLHVSCDSKLYAVDQGVWEHTSQPRNWQTDFHSRICTLEKHRQEDANKMARVEDRLSVIEKCISCLPELRQLNDQQSLDLKQEIVKIRTTVSDLEEILGCNSRPDRKESIHKNDVEKMWHSKKLTVIPKGEDTMIHRLCVVECHIDMIASILTHIETRFSNLNGQMLESNWAGSTRKRYMRKRSNGKSSSSNTMSSSQEACESSDASSPPDTAPLVYNNLPSYRNDLTGFSEHVELPALHGMTDHQPQENSLLEHENSQLQLILGRGSQCYLEDEVLFDEGNLTWSCPTIMEESEIPTE